MGAPISSAVLESLGVEPKCVFIFQLFSFNKKIIELQLTCNRMHPLRVHSSMNFDKNIHCVIKFSITAKNEVLTSCPFAVNCCHPHPRSTTDLLSVKRD